MDNTKAFQESGILLVDKPQDWTSHDVVNCVRRRFKFKKVGHCGTLDPLATGLLVIVIGKATKTAAKFSGQDKTYVATLTLGSETDSQDSTGKVVNEGDFSEVSEEQVRKAIAAFQGDLMQMPPMVSAIKKNGKKLYKLAREGKVVEREPRKITISKNRVTRVEVPEADFEMVCSKGTYIRTICHDIGEELGCHGHMSQLRRTTSGFFDIADAYSIDTIKGWEKEDLFSHFMPLAEVIEKYLSNTEE